VILGVAKALPALINPKGGSKKDYLGILSLIYQLSLKIRKDGLLAIENDINEPYKSNFFKRYGSSVLANRHLTDFICDNLKVIISCSITPNDLENLIDTEIETYQQESLLLSDSVARMADSMPGLGLVAAVLGVVLTMNKIDQPAKIIGHSIAVALLGTFIGILSCYGFFGPIAANLEQKANEDTVYFKVVKIALLSFSTGTSPMIIAEFARKAIPVSSRPSFDELNKMKKG
jgi:chemotaxis protein MotA